MSLIEVMLGSALGLFVSFGFIQLYLSTKHTFHLQQAIVSMQENGRFAAHFLSESIRMAGFARCGSSEDFTNPNLAIRGYSSTVPDFLERSIKAGTDSVEVGECTFRDETEKFEKFAFFIGEIEKKEAARNSLYALYVKYRNDGNKRELVSDVEDMQIRYGVVVKEGDKKIAHYLSADEMKERDWKKVKAVQIALLLNSEKPILKRPEPYEFMGKKLLPSKLLRREWHIYVACRE